MFSLYDGLHATIDAGHFDQAMELAIALEPSHPTVQTLQEIHRYTRGDRPAVQLGIQSSQWWTTIGLRHSQWGKIHEKTDGNKTTSAALVNDWRAFRNSLLDRPWASYRILHVAYSTPHWGPQGHYVTTEHVLTLVRARRYSTEAAMWASTKNLHISKNNQWRNHGASWNTGREFALFIAPPEEDGRIISSWDRRFLGRGFNMWHGPKTGFQPLSFQAGHGKLNPETWRFELCLDQPNYEHIGPLAGPKHPALDFNHKGFFKEEPGHPGWN